MSKNDLFKSAVMGYDKEEVASFINHMKETTQQEKADLTARLETMEKEKEALAQKLEASEKTRGEMQTAMDTAQEYITTLVNKGKALERELDDAREKAAIYLERQDAISQLLSDTQSRCGQLIEEAQAHGESIRRQAQEEGKQILDDARRTAQNIIQDSKTDADKIQNGMLEQCRSMTSAMDQMHHLLAQMAQYSQQSAQIAQDPYAYCYSDRTPLEELPAEK